MAHPGLCCNRPIRPGNKWGTLVEANAYFGVKGRSPTGKSAQIATHEDIGGKHTSETDAFRAYTGYADSADDYGQFLNNNPRFKAAFLFLDDSEKFTDEMAKAHYATDPQYKQKIMKLIHTHHLDQYDK